VEVWKGRKRSAEGLAGKLGADQQWKGQLQKKDRRRKKGAERRGGDDFGRDTGAGRERGRGEGLNKNKMKKGGTPDHSIL